MKNNIELPVSMGEALDKLTILDIKMKKITDVRRSDVEKEFNLLSSKLEKYKQEYKFYYNILLSINESIWDMQDIFRDSKNPQEQNKLCIKIINENDNRFRVKKKINNLNNSSLKEQKGYKPRKAFVMTNQGMGDLLTVVGAIRYLSTCYDIVTVICCTPYYIRNLKLLYEDDNNIKFYVANDNKNMDNKDGNGGKLSTEQRKLLEIELKDADFISCGHHCHAPKSISQIPFSFYKDMNIDPTYFWKYFHINIPKSSYTLFNNLQNIDNYIFLHNTSSQGEIFSIEYIVDKFNIDYNNTLIINPCINIYKNTHKFYDIAQIFVFKLFAEYATTIINADKIFLTDSSFFCLSLNLPIKTTECYFKPRVFDYSHLFKDIDLLKKFNKPIFKKF